MTLCASDATGHLHQLALVSLTFQTVPSGKSYVLHRTEGKLRKRERPVMVARAGRASGGVAGPLLDGRVHTSAR